MTAAIEIETLAPVGARVRGADLRVMTGDAGWVRELLARHGVLVFPDQAVGDAEFVAFLRSLGELTFTRGETPLDGFPDLNVISNVGRTSAPRSSFHVDTSYVARPPAYTALRAVRVPERGGATQFTNQYLALETLPDDLRALVDGRSIRHVVTGVELGPDDESAAEHPIVRPHPVTGRPSLYLTTPARCAAVTGLDPAQSAEVVARLFAHSTQDAHVVDHAWRPGDVVIWDNACVLHRADHSGVVGDRVMHRGMVAVSG